MITQRLISFKIDESIFERLNSTISELPVNRNKFMNACVDSILGFVELQVEYAKKHNLPLENIPFMSHFE